MTTDFSPVDLVTARDRLRQLIVDLAVVRGRVTLASGIEADYYVDLRRVTLHHEASRYVGQVMLALLDEAGISFEAVGGLTMGADPVGHSVMRTAGDQGRAVDAFVVRKAQKSYGMGRQVEGPSVEGRDVVVVEDTSTTGGSALTAGAGPQRAGAHGAAGGVLVGRPTGAKGRDQQTPGWALPHAFSPGGLGVGPRRGPDGRGDGPDEPAPAPSPGGPAAGRGPCGP